MMMNDELKLIQSLQACAVVHKQIMKQMHDTKNRKRRSR